MFQPLALFIGLRYVRARAQKFFVSFLTWVAALGVALGVMALIVILSVMNGFENDIRDRLIALSAHARVQPVDAATSIDTLRALQPLLAGRAGVLAVAPYVEIEALAVHGGESQPLQLRGIDPASEPGVSELGQSLRDGRLVDIAAGDRLLLGALLADRLAVNLGDSLTLLVPGADAAGVPTPRLRQYVVAGIFEVGMQDADIGLAYTNLEAAQAMAGDDARSSGLRLRFDDVMAAPRLTEELRAELPGGFVARDWTQDHANYFRAIRIEKTMMSLILTLIVAIAAFNLVSMLVMVVNDKRTDIAILRTLGAQAPTVRRVFLTQGLVIGWAGVIVGVLLGLWVAANATGIAALLERVLGFEFMDADVYYLTQIPTEVQSTQVLLVALSGLALTFAAVWWPARRAALVAPADALRYERL
jgi:lipoprotein-releasing system permease protein